MTTKKYRVIFDTNVWISFIIGKRLASLKKYISSGLIIIIYCDQLLQEIEEVTARPKLKKYFPSSDVSDMLHLIETIGLNFKPENTYRICRDQKDNFLLNLIDISKAHYLVTGDKDLKELNPFKTAQILTPIEFEIELHKKAQ